MNMDDLDALLSDDPRVVATPLDPTPSLASLALANMTMEELEALADNPTPAMTNGDGASAEASKDVPISLNTIRRNITPEQVRNFLYEMLGADSIRTWKTIGHDGSPWREDLYGFSKADLHDAVMAPHGSPVLDQLARQVSAPSLWHGQITSQRFFRVQEGRKKARPIDPPSQVNRILQGFLLPVLVALVEKCGALHPNVVGFREIQEFPDYFRSTPTKGQRKGPKRKDGITIQDVFGGTVQKMLRNHGPRALLIDQMDSYGNLPHKAIHIALIELGLNHEDRRMVVELVRVRTLTTKGLLKPTGSGIEQGSPLAPLIFNLVMSLVARTLAKLGFQSAYYGDDIVIAADNYKGAKRAFAAYKDVTGELGFNPEKVRPLGTGDKDSKIRDARSQKVTLIKTFKVTTGQIGLTDDKAKALLKRLAAKGITSPHLNQLMKENHYKLVSKQYFATLLKQDPNPSMITIEDGPVEEPPALNYGVPPAHKAEGSTRGVQPLEDQDTEDAPDVDVHTDGDTGLKDTTSYSNVPYGDRLVGSDKSDSGKTATASTAGEIGAGKPKGGRSADLRIGSDRGVTATAGVEVAGHGPSTLKPVFLRVTDKDVALLAKGHRLHAGDEAVYRSKVIDLGDIEDKVPDWRWAHAIHQLRRVGSVSGKTSFLVHPVSPLLPVLRDLEGEGWKVAEAEDGRGLRITLTRLRAKPARVRPTKEPPPDVELIVHPPRPVRSEIRQWTVLVTYGRPPRSSGPSPFGTPTRRHVAVASMNRGIATVEALAAVLAAAGAPTVAVPASGLLTAHLIKGARARQVALAQAMWAFTGWRWTAVGDWLVGDRVEAATEPDR